MKPGLIAGMALTAGMTLVASASNPVVVRVATFNLEDVRTTDLVNPDGTPRADHPRLKRLAEVLQRVRPNIVLLNEIAYDQEGAPGFVAGGEAGQNARRFVEQYLGVAQAPDLEPLAFRAFARPSNTGQSSGMDLDNDGRAVTGFPEPPGGKPDGSPGEQTPEGRAFGNDCWGFGTFPGQYAMALLVDPRLTIDEEAARTFRLVPWDYMPGAFLPTNPDGSAWFDEKERAAFRLSSKSHWDVPVKLPNGAVLHVLASHPTPPAFDGPEQRNKKRNHDEIRFWSDYLDRSAWIVDDANRPGGLEAGRAFVIVGDLNADPDEGSSFKNPITKFLLTHPRVNGSVTPTSGIDIPRLDPDDTAMFRLRVDYVLPSRELDVVASGVWRDAPSGGGAFPSDHFPVWMDVSVPAPADEAQSGPSAR